MQFSYLSQNCPDNYDPEISVVVPVYNEESTISECIIALLNQSYPNDKREIILVDNKSTDDTINILQPFVDSGKISLLRETTILNEYGARNTGVRSAKGEIIAFIDADCIAEKYWLKNLISPFKTKDVGCVAGVIIPFEPKNYIQTYWAKDFLLSKIKQDNVLFGGNCAFRKAVFEKIGYFRENIISKSDSELLSRMRQKTYWKKAVAETAIVYHENVSTLLGLLIQSIRYSINLKNDITNQYNTRNELNFLILSIQVSFRIIKRWIEVLIQSKDFSNRIQIQGYIFRPFLEWIVALGNIVGYRSSEKIIRK